MNAPVAPKISALLKSVHFYFTLLHLLADVCGGLVVRGTDSSCRLFFLSIGDTLLFLQRVTISQLLLRSFVATAIGQSFKSSLSGFFGLLGHLTKCSTSCGMLSHRNSYLQCQDPGGSSNYSVVRTMLIVAETGWHGSRLSLSSSTKPEVSVGIKQLGVKMGSRSWPVVYLSPYML